MSTLKSISLAIGVGIVADASIAKAQGTFGNLDFESANVSQYTPASTVPISDALPGWAGFLGGTPVSTAWYDANSLAGASIAVIDSGLASHGYSPLSGNYSALLFGEGGPFPAVPATISQTGDIPAGTLSLLVMMRWQSATPIVSLGGQNLNMIPLQTFPNYTLYGANIASFAGQTTTLSFTAPPPVVGSSFLLLDDITFSPSAIPEPTAEALLGLGGSFFGVRLMRRNRFQASKKPMH